MTFSAAAGHNYLPVFIQGNQTTDLGRFVLLGDWTLSLVALIVLWRRPPHTVLDVWLIVVICVWLFDIALSAILNTGRYDERIVATLYKTSQTKKYLEGPLR
jgi:hypothetical protein